MNGFGSGNGLCMCILGMFSLGCILGLDSTLEMGLGYVRSLFRAGMYFSQGISGFVLWSLILSMILVVGPNHVELRFGLVPIVGKLFGPLFGLVGLMLVNYKDIHGLSLYLYAASSFSVWSNNVDGGSVYLRHYKTV